MAWSLLRRVPVTHKFTVSPTLAKNTKREVYRRGHDDSFCFLIKVVFKGKWLKVLGLAQLYFHLKFLQGGTKNDRN